MQMLSKSSLCDQIRQKPLLQMQILNKLSLYTHFVAKSTKMVNLNANASKSSL